MSARRVLHHVLFGLVALAAGTLLPGCLVLRDMPRPVRLFWGGAIVVIAILGFVGTIMRLALAKKARKRYETAVILVETGHAEQALPAIRAGKRYELNPAGRERWDALEMAAYVEMNDIARLLELFDASPKPFTTDETAALLAARAQIETRRLEAFSELRRVWVSREGKVDQWLGLESDLLVLQEQPEEAITLLRRFKFEGPPEGRRLARLAHLLADSDPALAQKAITMAAQLGPKIADVWLFTARYHEHAGRHQAAYAAYVRAFECEPKDPFIRHHLAEFLVCQGAYTQALQHWGEAARPPSLDFLWLKLLFWQRVANDTVGGTPVGSCPPGPLKRFIEKFLRLDATAFWDEVQFESQAHAVRDLPEAGWLRVLEALRNGAEDEALAQLNLGLRSAHSVLETALRQVLTYRRTGFFEPGAVCIAANTPSAFHHPLFVRLDQWINGTLAEDPADLLQLMETGQVWPVLLRAAGWNAAAERLEAAA